MHLLGQDYINLFAKSTSSFTVFFYMYNYHIFF